MTQAERDRLVALKKAKKKLITQKQAADEIGVTERVEGALCNVTEVANRSWDEEEQSSRELKVDR